MDITRVDNREDEMVEPPLRGNSLATFALSSEQRAILDSADAFARDRLWPLQRKMDDEEWWPSDVMPISRRRKRPDS